MTITYEYIQDPTGGPGMQRKLNSHCAPLISMHIPAIGGARRYQLEGIVEHIGTTLESSGNHYVSFIKKDNQLYRISDAQVTATIQLSRQPYVSLYRLQN